MKRKEIGLGMLKIRHTAEQLLGREITPLEWKRFKAFGEGVIFESECGRMVLEAQWRGEEPYIRLALSPTAALNGCTEAGKRFVDEAYEASGFRCFLVVDRSREFPELIHKRPRDDE